MPEFYMIFARKIPEFYTKTCPKFFPRILGGTCPPGSAGLNSVYGLILNPQPRKGGDGV